MVVRPYFLFETPKGQDFRSVTLHPLSISNCPLLSLKIALTVVECPEKTEKEAKSIESLLPPTMLILRRPLMI